jgi:transcriptional antiterminator
MKNYVIKKILSNNVVLVEKENQSYILVGKGIGFGKKKGFVLEDSQVIEEKFISLKGINENEYEKLLSQVDPRIIELVEQIVDMIKRELGEDTNENVYVGLIDYINFLIKRINEGIDIVNPFMFETKLLYSTEYDLAQRAVNILKDNLNIHIPEEEIGFLALHIYGGRGNNYKKEVLNNWEIMNKIVSYILEKLNVDIDDKSYGYKSFIMHLRDVADGESDYNSIDSSILLKVKEDLVSEFSVANGISQIMEKILNIRIPESEVGYITLHIHRLSKTNKKINKFVKNR